MTAPRLVLRGATYLVTRRCTQRQFLLRPSKATNQVVQYLLAMAAKRFDIELHAYCVMSNHFHLVVTDPDARLPACMQYFDGLVGRALNALLGRRENFWGSDTFSAVELTDPRSIVDKVAYTLANPVEAGLIRSASRWPGLWSHPEAIGGDELLVRRPSHFFNPKGSLPESIALKLTTPPGFPTAAAFQELLHAALAEKEAAAVKKIGTFLGVARVLAQKVTARTSREEPLGQLNPRVAGRDARRRTERLARLVSFLADYRTALREWRRGNRSIIFPAGTYLMRVACGVACAGAG